jgi:UDP-glucuronate 4-epimerase
MKVLVTGTAGFIGFHTAQQLLRRGDQVIGIDVVNDYYDVALKEARLRKLDEQARTTNGAWRFHRIDLADRDAVATVFAEEKPDRVINLAAQAGVRYSLENPRAYIDANVYGFMNILEGCRQFPVQHLTYASTSSVYGNNRAMPFSEHAGGDHPVQLYAATKRANELMAHSYSHLFGIPTTGLRFFTVYGPWSRPDMAPFLFTKNIIEGKPIKLFNYGNHSRDFTYVDDIVEGVIRVNDRPAEANPAWDALKPYPASSNAPFRVYNIGNSSPVKLTDFVAAIEASVGKKAIIELAPMQPGDVPDTIADVSELEAATGYRPATPVVEGVRRFVEWYRDFYKV